MPGCFMEDSILKPLIPQLEGIIDRTLERERVPGAAIGIVHDQEHVWSRGFGYADLASDRFPTADTLFRCGSITKTFTATAILQLRDEGKLAIDDPLVRYIPEFGAVKARFGKPQDVTIRRLLTHTSGLAGEGPNNGWEKLEFPPIEDMVAALGRTEILIEPETQYKYSNLGHGMLLRRSDRASSGRRYPDYIQRNLLELAGDERQWVSSDRLDAALKWRPATRFARRKANRRWHLIRNSMDGTPQGRCTRRLTTSRDGLRSSSVPRRRRVQARKS